MVKVGSLVRFDVIDASSVTVDWIGVLTVQGQFNKTYLSYPLDLSLQLFTITRIFESVFNGSLRLTIQEVEIFDPLTQKVYCIYIDETMRVWRSYIFLPVYRITVV